MQLKKVFFKKIGVFLFITYDPPERANIGKNIEVLETKLITFTNNQLINTYLFDEVLLAIK